MHIIKNPTGRVVGVHSWTEGFKSLALPRPAGRLSDKEALAHALYLARHVSFEAADKFLDRWCEVGESKNSPSLFSSRNGS